MNNWRELKRHPLSAEYRDLKGKPLDRLRDSLKVGFLPDKPLTLDGGEVLDGWQRFTLCLELGVEPPFQDLPGGWTPELYVEAVNDARRHESPEIMEKRAKERRERVAKRREAGESIRVIAAEEGVSKAQVERDLDDTKTNTDAKSETGVGENAGVPGGTPENSAPKVTGKDRKKYPPRKPKPKPIGDASEEPVWCDRCTRMKAQARDCPQCQDAQEAADKAAAKRKGTKAGAQKNGQQCYDWRPFHDHFGGLLRQIDVMGKLYGAKESPEAGKLRDALGAFKTQFTEFHASVRK